MDQTTLGKLSTRHGDVCLRWARPEDAVELCRLIQALAVYERLEGESRPDPGALARDLDAANHEGLNAIVAVNVSGHAVGFALFFSNYSTFLTRWGIYLEDLFVEPGYRGLGIGFALLKAVAAIATERGCERLDWAVLDWNTPSINFYESIGAKMKGDWRIMRLDRPALKKLVDTTESQEAESL